MHGTLENWDLKQKIIQEVEQRSDTCYEFLNLQISNPNDENCIEKTDNNRENNQILQESCLDYTIDLKKPEQDQQAKTDLKCQNPEFEKYLGYYSIYLEILKKDGKAAVDNFILLKFEKWVKRSNEQN